MVKYKLGDIATVQMGYSFRSRLESVPGGAIAVIQMKDLLDNNTCDCSSLVKIDMGAIKEHHLAKQGDLVFRSRGLLSNTAIIKHDPGAAVVAAPLIRIRVNDTNVVLPDYLNWYISQSDAQVFFTKRAKGSAQKMISKNTIEDLSVAVPVIEKQKQIIELAYLSVREQEILLTITKKRKQYISSTLLKIAKGE